jgi:hypothetical protein
MNSLRLPRFQNRGFLYGLECLIVDNVTNRIREPECYRNAEVVSGELIDKLRHAPYATIRYDLFEEPHNA